MRNCLFIALICLCPANLFSQEPQRLGQQMKGKLSLGWEFGANRSYVVEGERKYDSFSRYGSVNGFEASLFAKYNLSNRWGLTYAISYSQKGMKLERNDESHRFHYYGWTIAPSFSFKHTHVYTGFYIAYLIKSKGNLSAYQYPALRDDEVYPFDMGLRLGLGIDFFKRFELYINHELGLANIYSDPYYGANRVSIYGYWHGKNRLFSLSLRTTFKELQLRKQFQ